jgi:hypothetical protein
MKGTRVDLKYLTTQKKSTITENIWEITPTQFANWYWIDGRPRFCTPTGSTTIIPEKNSIMLPDEFSFGKGCGMFSADVKDAKYW